MKIKQLEWKPVTYGRLFSDIPNNIFFNKCILYIISPTARDILGYTQFGHTLLFKVPTDDEVKIFTSYEEDQNENIQMCKQFAQKHFEELIGSLLEE